MPTEMSSPARPSMFASLRVRNFRIFLTGQVISFIGGWTQRIAQDWLVLSLTGSATAVGITTAMQFLPTVLFGPFGGLLADRFPKRRVLLVTQSVLLASSSTLAALVVLGSVQVWHIYLLAAIFGSAVAVDNPTRQAFINEVVESATAQCDQPELGGVPAGRAGRAGGQRGVDQYRGHQLGVRGQCRLVRGRPGFAVVDAHG